MFEPENLKRWTMPAHYFGAVWPNYYSAGVGRSRDSDALERSNFACMLKALGGETETVIVVRESHWAVGWVEWIAIHQDDEKALHEADEIVGAMADYPVIDGDHFSDLEWTEAAEHWDGLTPREKVQYALEERSRYHWLADKPVWTFGRKAFHELQDYDCTPLGPIARALEERLRCS